MSDRREYVFPASFAQERLWFLACLDPEIALYNLNMYTRLPGRIDPDRLERAFAMVVDRHEALRTALTIRNGALMQVVTTGRPVRLARSDLSRLPPAEREAELERIARADAASPISLDEAPLWRARLVRLAADDWRLVHIVHHAVFDGTSAVNFDAELTECYAALTDDRPPSLPQLLIQYADYAVWQRQRFAEDAALVDQFAYWRDKLADLPTELGLASDRSRPALPSYGGDEHFLTLPADLTTALNALARGSGATLFMTLLAGFKTVLSRYAGHGDIVVGTPVAGRTQPELAPLVGMFVNLLVLRTDLSDDPTFADLLRRVRTTVLDALEHQDIPFGNLVERLQPERHLSRTPLYQVGFNLLPTTRRGLFSNGTARMDLDVEIVQADGELQVYLTYSTDLFDRDTVRRLAESFHAVLTAAVAQPDSRLSELPVPAPAERDLLRDFGQGEPTRVPAVWPKPVETPTSEPTLIQLIEATTADAPDAVAVIHGAETLTYRQLAAQSNRIGHRLRQLGAGPETLVAVCAERSLDQLIGLLGVLKSGAAYLPLDSDYPPERLAFMIRDAAAPILLTQEDLLDRLPETPVTTVLLDRAEGWADQPDTPPRPMTRPDNLAYAIYTSGSTGHPKGVLIRHGSLLNLLTAMRAQFECGSGDVWLNATTPTFDMSVPELFLPLVSGGRLVIADRDTARDGAMLRKLISDHSVTHMQAVPATWRLLLDAGFHEPAITALVGAEAVPAGLARELRGHVRRLANMYGPTETTVWSTISWLPPDLTEVRIGRPLAGTTVYVLDEGLRPTPIGVPGEIFIGGVGVARGYLGQPKLTAERFVPDPYGAPGSRLYRTGDRARWRHDGQLDFLGRPDSQIKLRGHRIELGEIEAALSSLAPVAEAAVIVQDEPDAALARLVAYVSATPGTTVTSADAIAHLSKTLPAHMVPAAVIPLDGLPLTANGKLDRARLPTPERRHLATRASTRPETDSEELVADIWAEVLHLDHVDALDDFFELGGHSLLAAKMIDMIRAACGVDLPLRALFDNRTVRRLARAVEEQLLADISRLSDEEARRQLVDGDR